MFDSSACDSLSSPGFDSPYPSTFFRNLCPRYTGYFHELPINFLFFFVFSFSSLFFAVLFYEFFFRHDHYWADWLLITVLLDIHPIKCYAKKKKNALAQKQKNA
ncbi:hypothetical protein VTK26DRAFT_6653 [Humicola hyalothermophila]